MLDSSSQRPSRICHHCSLQSTRSLSRRVPSTHNLSQLCQRSPLITHGHKNLVLSENPLPSSPPFLMIVAKSFCMLVCQFLMSSKRTSELEVSCRCSGSVVVSQITPASSLRWY